MEQIGPIIQGGGVLAFAAVVWWEIRTLRLVSGQQLSAIKDELARISERVASQSSQSAVVLEALTNGGKRRHR